MAFLKGAREAGVFLADHQVDFGRITSMEPENAPLEGFWGILRAGSFTPEKLVAFLETITRRIVNLRGFWSLFWEGI